MGYETKLIDHYVGAMCLQTCQNHFYPNNIEESLQLPRQDVLKRLLQLVNENVLILRWELRCPVQDCADVVDRFEKIPEFGQISTCHNGHELKIDASVVFPVFVVHPKYR